jgi:hypothetical protein
MMYQAIWYNSGGLARDRSGMHASADDAADDIFRVWPECKQVTVRMLQQGSDGCWRDLSGDLQVIDRATSSVRPTEAA